MFAKRGLYERFRSTTARLGWKRKNERVLLGLSGGRDSVTLLHLLKVSGHCVTAAHLNHRLRGRESVGDEQFVRRLCREWRVPLVVGRENVADRARRYGLSIEEAARIARYRFLAAVARKKKLRKVVAAHHQRDQAETLLLKIFRGCNRHELKGMAMSRSLPDLNWNPTIAQHSTFRVPRSVFRVHLLRPLLEAPPLEIALYARRNRLPHREDFSNRDLARPRNWIRHRLLPLIERRLNRNIVRTLARLARISHHAPLRLMMPPATSSPARPFSRRKGIRRKGRPENRAC